MSRSVIIHGVLLAASLIAAYLVWTREPTTTEETVAIVDFRELDRVVYTSENRKVEITREKDDEGVYHWGRVETTSKPPRIPRRPPPVKSPTPAPPAAAGAKPPAPPPPARPAVSKPAPAPTRPAPPPAARPRPPAPAPSKTPAQKPQPGPRSERVQPGGHDTVLATADDGLWAAPSIAGPPKPPAKPAAPTPAPTPTAGAAPAAADAPPAPAPPAPPAAAPPPAKPRTKVTSFKVNEAGDKLMDTLSELPAVRRLGELPQDKLKEFGLLEGKTKLVLQQGATKRTLVVGNQTHGNRDFYVLDESSKQVYIVRPKIFQELKHAESRLVDRRLHTFEQTEVDRVVLEARGKSKTLLHHERLKGKSSFWTTDDAGDKTKGDEGLRSFMTKLDRLRGLDYADPDELPKTLDEALTVTYYRGSKKLGVLKLLEHATLAPNTVNAIPAGAKMYYAKTENTRIAVKLSKTLAERLLSDLDRVFGEEKTAKEPTEKSEK